MIPVFRDKASLVRMPYLFGLSLFSVCKCFVEAFETMSEILAYSSLFFVFFWLSVYKVQVLW